MRILLLCILLSMIPTLALADDFRPSIDEMSGNWVAISFVDGPETKVCAAGSLDNRLTFRADSNDLEVRTTDPGWSLSADAQGDITVRIGPVQKTIHMQTFNSTTLMGQIEPADAAALLDAMDKASAASIQFGSKKTISLSLAGSTRALNSFRTCAGVHGFVTLGPAAGNAASPF